MGIPREVELKLAVAAEDLPRLRRRLSRLGAPQAKALENVYYDTTDFALAGRGMALRVRRVGRRWLQTLKTENTATALSRRGEWEMPAPRGRLDVARFAGTPLETLLRTAPALRLEPCFRTRFERTLWTTRDGAIEIALDQGEISAADRVAPICELELELKAGDPAALWTLALDLVGAGAAAIALLPFGESKAARGVRLALNEPVRPAKANAKAFTPSLRSGTTTGVALHSIIATGTEILLANAHGMRASDDPEYTHQARVAVRRMRSAVRLFKREVDFPPRLDAELRWIGRALGRARDWDVYAGQTLPAFLPPASPETHRLERATARARIASRRRLRQCLSGPRFAALTLRLAQWADARAGESAALRTFAPTALKRANRRLLKAARGFSALPPPAQHRVRILAKRLRYAVDALARAFRRGATAVHSARLSELQDVLGELNDIIVAQALLSRNKQSKFANEMQSALAARRAELVKAGDAALSKLAELPEFWR